MDNWDDAEGYYSQSLLLRCLLLGLVLLLHYFIVLAGSISHVYVHTMYHFLNIVYLCDCYCSNLATGYYMK